MAILNAFDLCENYESPNMGCNVKGALTPSAIDTERTNCDTDGSPTNRGRLRKKKISPNRHNDKVQLLTTMTEKRYVRKKNELFSSFPLAAQIYRASSGEFKAYKKSRQKSRKSVLTLPNLPNLLPQACTVSDMNDSEYFNRKNDPKRIGNKRLPNQNKKMTIRTKGFEVFDRDEKHIFLDYSSTDLVNNQYGGDGRKVSGRRQKGAYKDIASQDVWSVLRNINQFQFRSSTKRSDESIDSPQKKKNFKNRYGNIHKGRRLVETRRTEEISYIANIEIQSKTSGSRSSSFDRVTVISKKEVINKKALENTKQPQKDISKKPKLQRIAFQPGKGVFKPTQLKENSKLNTKIKQENENEIDTYPPCKETNEKYSSFSIKESMDSSNCFRQSENDLRDISSNNFKTKPALTHPDDIKEIIYNSCHQSYKERPNSELSYGERMTRGLTRMDTNNDPYEIFYTDITQKPKPRLVTTMPSGAAMPKMTAVEIKRRLAQIRYPLVILGKDQLSSNMEVFHYETQFKGLDERMWPFMEQWNASNKPKKGQANKRILPIKCIANNLRKANNDLLVSKAKDKRLSTYDIASKKKEVKCGTYVNEVVIPPLVKKSTPVRQFKDKMLKLLYKKSSVSVTQNYVEPVPNEKPRLFKEVQTQSDFVVCTETLSVPSKQALKKVETMVQIKKETPKKPEEILKAFNKSPNLSGHKVSEAKYPWARAKWASDFIDNVMEKINNGVYYKREKQNNLIKNQNAGLTVEITQKIDIGTCIDFKDVSIQTMSSIENIKKKVDFETNLRQPRSDSLTEIQNDDILLNIPGFDEVLPELEIKTLNGNQIAIKHCMANVMVQFDVAVPNRLNSTMRLDEETSVSSTCIPLSVTSSHTKIFKCSTRILNAVLPAELCTVIPKLMRHIFEPSTTYSSSFSDMNMTLSDLNMFEPLYPVKHLCPVRNQSDVSMGPLANPWTGKHFNREFYPSTMAPTTSQRVAQPNLWIPCCTPEHLPLYMSPLLKEFITGRFPSTNMRIHQAKRVSRKEVIRNIKLKRSENVILPHPCKKVWMGIMSVPIKPVISVPDVNVIVRRNSQLSTDRQKDLNLTKQMGNCAALQLYKRNETSEISYPGDFASLLYNTWSYCKFNIQFNLPQYDMALQVKLNNKLNTLNLMVGNNESTQNAISVTLSNFSSNSYCKSIILKSPLIVSAISAFDRPPLIVKPEELLDTEPETITKQLERSVRGKTRKRSFIRLYRKCKSAFNTSNTSNNMEKSCTPLDRIVNIDDFTQALGATKAFSNVFSGEAGQKLLSCVDEMKSWIKDITPCQALLILLLTNKKDTTTLLRFRPVLLQGIAVNRITRATELDMEIEVIEKENVQMTQQGVCCLPASIDNQDSLLEELCWIAKTTASDYQRPFNDTSEKLIKDLLGKRKKLNPSYLRVMARYVGLGLLKTPKRISSTL